MADVELIIKIPEEIYQHYKKVWQKRRGSIPESCIAFGIQLPKGHGRIIDEDQIPGDSSWDFADRLMSTPTIIEAEEVQINDK